MNSIVRFFGICFKYILLNSKAVISYLFQPGHTAVDLADTDTVVFTHNLGGGTEGYAKTHFDAPGTLTIRLISYRNNNFFALEQHRKTVIVTGRSLFEILSSKKFENLYVNSLVSYTKPEQFLKSVTAHVGFSRMVYFVHDFHSVCPCYSFMYKKRYCAMSCSECRLGTYAVNVWRAAWHAFFAAADSVICFSQSSRDIMLRFYPELQDIIDVVPHSMDYCRFTKIHTENFRNIGIVGNCSNDAKGRQVISALSRYINKTETAKLIVIGKYPFFIHRNTRFVQYTGAYCLADLPDILISHQVGVIVFTSVCPETFSYTISELMMLGMPVVSLRLGAQGEKLESYDKAIFADDLKPETIMRSVKSYFEN